MSDNARSLRVRCGTWEQVAAFYERKLKGGRRLTVKVPFVPERGAFVTIALELPNEMVMAIEGRVETVQALPDGQRAAISLDLGGGVQELVDRLAALVADGLAGGAMAAPAGEGAAAEAPPQEAAAPVSVDDGWEDTLPVPAPLPIDAPIDELVEQPSQPRESDVAVEQREVFFAVERELRRIRSAGAHEVLGVPWDAKVSAIRAAYFGLTKRFHPDVFAKYRSDAIRQLVQEVFIAVNRAYDRMRDAAVAAGQAISAGPALMPHVGWLASPDELDLDDEPAHVISTPPVVTTPVTPVSRPATTPPARSPTAPAAAAVTPVAQPAQPVRTPAAPPRRAPTAPPVRELPPPQEFDDDGSEPLSIEITHTAEPLTAEPLTAEGLFGDMDLPTGQTGNTSQVNELFASGAVTARDRERAEGLAYDARRLLDGHAWTEARDKLAAALQIDPRNRAYRGLYHAAAGFALVDRSKPVEATTQFETAIVHDPSCELAKRGLEALRGGGYRSLRARMSGARTVGIDLGTTNSVVATIDESGHPRILANVQGDATTPSVVAFAPDGLGKPLVGMPARRQAVGNPDNTIFGAKRLIGRRYDDPEVQRLARTLPYRVVEAANGDAWVGAGGLVRSPQEISAHVLVELRKVAERYFGGAIGEAIITVPAYFDNQQRRATKDAAEVAGLKVRRLLNEPTAAALGYGAHRGANRRFAVCDLGGGTFDVSIVNVEDGLFEVISTHGDLFLGGDDFDRALIERLVAEIRRERGADIGGDPTALQRLKEEAQNAKHVLSGALEVTVHLPFLGKLPSGKPLHYERKVTRRELEEWATPLLERLSTPCREVVARCGLRPRDIDDIILVGGMTRMPAVQARIEQIFGRRPLKTVNPDEIVSIGAATQCAILDGTIEGVVLLDVTSRALGLDVGGGRYQQVIPRNATIPTREHKIVATTADGQTELGIDVYEGESRDLARNRHLGRFVCSGLPEAPAGEILVVVDFTVDVDGILKVSAAELGSGHRPELRLTATAGINRAEVRRLSRVVNP